MRRVYWIVAMSAAGLAPASVLGACRGQPSKPVPSVPSIRADEGPATAPPDAGVDARPDAVGGAVDASPPRATPGALLVEADDEALCVGEGNVVRRWGSSLRGSGGPVADATTFPDRVARLACGPNITCVVTEGGDIWCLGLSGGGNLGVVTTEQCPWGGGRKEPCSTKPVKVPGLPKMVDVAVGDGTCAVSEAGEVYCWGGTRRIWFPDAQGQTDGGMPPRTRAIVRVQGLANIRRIRMGGGLACAQDGRGEVWCWGANNEGQLGRGTYTRNSVLPPARVRSLHGVSSMALGGDHACALAGDGVYCWGFNGLWAVDDKIDARCEENDPCATSPRKIALPTRAAIVDLPSVGRSTCALDALGAVYCWGVNDHNTLGPGGETCSTIFSCFRRPRKLLGLPPFTQIFGSGSFLCGLTAGRELYCWGDVEGELHVKPTEPAQCKECVGPLFRVAL